MPGCDGSSRAYTHALLAAGVVSQGWPRKQLVIDEVSRVGDDRTWVEARPGHDGGMSIRCRIDYGSATAIGEQSLALRVTPQTYLRELADSRTFLLKHEADSLRSQGLGERTGYSDLLVFDEHGPIQNTLRYPDECVRHKALDVVGDLALAGCDLVGLIVANCSGHLLNAELVTTLLAKYERLPARRQSA
jgi:UDP-3-O-acyl-N-acetylglucosamine deacetylase